MLSEDPEKFRDEIKKSLRRHVVAINRHTSKGTYFFDYGNAFLLEASRAGADVMKPNGEFRYPSYVQDIVGPLCFDYGFGPFRWVCCSNDPADLEITDNIAISTLEKLIIISPDEIKQQMNDNITWIKAAGANKLVVGSQARILYADATGRMEIAAEFNKAVSSGIITAPVVIGRDHHDVSGTDSPFRETSNIYDGSRFTADMAVQNVIGDSFRGATWVSLHNGGGVGWGEVINGGFGMLIDGTAETERKLRMMLHWDVNNGIARRSWARNKEAMFALKKEMDRTPDLKVTVPYIADDKLIDDAFKD
jgi:urocanate hydratase